jgi:hypothetical protein
MSEKPPVDHDLMMQVHSKMMELGELLCELSDRLTDAQTVIITDLLPHYSSILTDMGMILDINRKTGVVNSFMPENMARRGQA